MPNSNWLYREMDQSGKKSKYCIHFKFLPVTDFRSRICSMLSCWVLFLCCGLKLSSMFLCWINIFCATLAIKSARWVWSAWIKATFLLDGDNDGVISNGAHPPRNALHPPPPWHLALPKKVFAPPQIIHILIWYFPIWLFLLLNL